MSNVITLPQKSVAPKALPRQRVFYVGFRYVGPMFCQDVQQLYLKRKGLAYGKRCWAMITYAKYDESDRRTYSIELMECEEKAVPEMLNMFDLEEEISICELREMGWQGELAQTAEIKSLLHPCYDGLWFPDYVKPYNWGGRTFGTKIMAQSRSAKAILEKHDVHAYTVFKQGGEEWVWMNLAKIDGTGFKPVPVFPVKSLPVGSEIVRAQT